MGRTTRTAEDVNALAQAGTIACWDSALPAKISPQDVASSRPLRIAVGRRSGNALPWVKRNASLVWAYNPRAAATRNGPGYLAAQLRMAPMRGANPVFHFRRSLVHRESPVRSIGHVRSWSLVEWLHAWRRRRAMPNSPSRSHPGTKATSLAWMKAKLTRYPSRRRLPLL